MRIPIKPRFSRHTIPVEAFKVESSLLGYKKTLQMKVINPVKQINGFESSRSATFSLPTTICEPRNRINLDRTSIASVVVTLVRYQTIKDFVQSLIDSLCYNCFIRGAMLKTIEPL